MKETQKITRVVAIESSCDDTSLAIVALQGRSFTVQKMVSWSQLAIHKDWGGVVPELAARSHLEKIQPLLDQLNPNWEEIDLIAVTAYPGLPSALAVGVTAGYTLGAIYEKPVVDVHHIMGHVFSVLLERSIDDLELPYCVLTVSGGHNDVYYVDKYKNTSSSTKNQHSTISHKKHHLGIGSSVRVGPYIVKKISQTADDAAGEVFDKVARMLGGPYPGGKWIGDQAQNVIKKNSEDPSSEDLNSVNQNGENQSSANQNGENQNPENQKTFKNSLTKPKLTDNNQFSLSGLKSQTWNLIEKLKKSYNKSTLPDPIRDQVAYDFQETITSALAENFVSLIDSYQPVSVGLVGGVSANLSLRKHIRNLIGKDVLLPKEFIYCTDNAAMIGVVGVLQYKEIGL